MTKNSRRAAPTSRVAETPKARKSSARKPAARSGSKAKKSTAATGRMRTVATSKRMATASPRGRKGSNAISRHLADETGLAALDPSTHPSRDATHFRRIVAAVQGVEAADVELREAVAAAREAGDSWSVIGAALDTTRQAAFQRFGRGT